MSRTLYSQLGNARGPTGSKRFNDRQCRPARWTHGISCLVCAHTLALALVPARSIDRQARACRSLASREAVTSPSRCSHHTVCSTTQTSVHPLDPRTSWRVVVVYTEHVRLTDVQYSSSCAQTQHSPVLQCACRVGRSQRGSAHGDEQLAAHALERREVVARPSGAWTTATTTAAAVRLLALLGHSRTLHHQHTHTQAHTGGGPTLAAVLARILDALPDETSTRDLAAPR